MQTFISCKPSMMMTITSPEEFPNFVENPNRRG